MLLDDSGFVDAADLVVWSGPAVDMNSIPQQAVTNGYRNIEYLRAHPITESSRVVWNESAP